MTPSTNYWRPDYMPRISNYFLGCISYIFTTEKAALENDGLNGATGFMLRYRTEVAAKPFSHYYIVTARHLIRRDPPGDTWLRLPDSHGGSPKAIRLTPEMWECHPDGDDVAVLPMSRVNLYPSSQGRVLEYSWLLTKDDQFRFGIGIGDDVFWAGKLLRRTGRAVNAPILRMGHIAAMPDYVIQKDTDYELEVYLVESFSIIGKSGSPVMVHIPALSLRPTEDRSYRGPWLLGVDCGHIERALEINNQEENDNDTKRIVHTNSGVMLVTPSWKLDEVLRSEVLERDRLAYEKLRLSEDGGAVPD